MTEPWSDDDWIKQHVEKQRKWMRDRGFPYDEKLPDYAVRYIEKIEQRITELEDESRQWEKESLVKLIKERDLLEQERDALKQELRAAKAELDDYTF